ncbi:hypothetical protein F3Y22_tig00110925pilonHSYRG00072 [Hibiscus syriacus]|uniref:RNase H type-1 domain-containing protein n=1 Tax=Hibiscus syriacus TaxID=106335 RepID=A0A6A2ZGC0_HIBSY|nr:hypothetical protein F3Y22_tig00110925pilonHSYRG00072 [Hibiscus syriacus]
MPESLDRRSCSRLWKGISLIWNDVKEGLTWNIGDGKTVDIWWEPLLSDVGALHTQVLDQSRTVNLPHVSVASMVNNEGEWKWSEISNLLPQWIKLRLAATPPPHNEQGGDRLGWKWRVDRRILVKSAYEHKWTETEQNDNIEYRTWNTIAKFQGMLRIRMFLCTHMESVLEHSRRLQNESYAANKIIWSGIRGKKNVNGEQVKWTPPPPGWVKLNTDGARTLNERLTSCGGVLRGSSGLQQAWRLGERKITLETDNLEVVQLLQAKEIQSQSFTLMHAIKEPLEKDWTVKINHIPKIGNLIADRLAKIAKFDSMDCSVYLNPPIEVRWLLKQPTISLEITRATVMVEDTVNMEDMVVNMEDAIDMEVPVVAVEITVVGINDTVVEVEDTVVEVEDTVVEVEDTMVDIKDTVVEVEDTVEDIKNTVVDENMVDMEDTRMP